MPFTIYDLRFTIYDLRFTIFSILLRLPREIGKAVISWGKSAKSGALAIDYLRFTIDYCSAFSAAEQRTPSHGDLLGI